MTMADTFETFNKFLVAAQGDHYRIMRLSPQLLSKDDCLLLAAWLVAMADYEGDEFPALLEKVRGDE